MQVLGLLCRLLEKMNLNQVGGWIHLLICIFWGVDCVSPAEETSEHVPCILLVLQVSVQNTLVASAPGSQAWELELSLTQRSVPHCDVICIPLWVLCACTSGAAVTLWCLTCIVWARYTVCMLKADGWVSVVWSYSPPASLHSSLMNSRVAESGNSGIDAPARNWGEVLSWKAGEHLLNGAASPTSLADKGSWPTVALQQLLVKVRADGRKGGGGGSALFQLLPTHIYVQDTIYVHSHLDLVELSAWPLE